MKRLTQLRNLTLAAGLIMAFSSETVHAQSSHKVLADFVTRPSGANSAFTVALTMSPSDTNISGFSFLVAYDNTQVTLTGISDNTGQPAADVQYTKGDESPLTGVPNVNTGVPVVADTATSLVNPTNLALLHFQTTNTYNDPNNRFWLHLEDHIDEGLINDSYEPIQTEYLTGESQQVPVSLSGFTLE